MRSTSEFHAAKTVIGGFVFLVATLIALISKTVSGSEKSAPSQEKLTSINLNDPDNYDHLVVSERSRNHRRGRCDFCDQKVGFFKGNHPECAEQDRLEKEARLALEQADAAKVEKIKSLLISCPSEQFDMATLAEHIYGLAEGDKGLITKGIKAWIQYLITNLGTDGVSQVWVEKAVDMVFETYGLTKSDIPEKDWAKFVRRCAAGDLDRNIVPSRVAIQGNLPFNLESDESVVWVFVGVEYLEDRVVRSTSRGYAGMSLRVAPGVYMHTGQSVAGQAVQGFVPIDSGVLAMTDRALVFHGSHKGLRIKYKDIASFTRYDHGFAICKGTQTARNQGFEVPDDLPGFPFVLLQGLARLHSTSLPKSKKRPS